MSILKRNGSIIKSLDMKINRGVSIKPLHNYIDYKELV